MARVKMNAKHEYEFIANFKILQNVFRSHKVDKVRRVRLRSLALAHPQALVLPHSLAAPRSRPAHAPPRSPSPSSA